MNVKLLEEILKPFNIRIKQLSYYVEALTHPSYAHQHNLKQNYQRLEFLGDSVISYIISNFLYRHNDNLNEGLMSQIKIYMERSESLANYAIKLQIDKLIMMGNGLKKVTNKILEDIFEAFIGAVYLDQGVDKVIKIFQFLVFDEFDIKKYQNIKSYKCQFQEYIDANEFKQYKKTNNENKIVYKQSLINGIWHAKLYFKQNLYGIGSGVKKVEAEENAAKDAINKLGKLN